MRGGRLGVRILDGYAMLVLGYLFLPILVIILYSFNKPAGKFNFVWKSFSLDAWVDPFRYPALVDAMVLSLRVAALSTLVAIIFGALIALALCRADRWRPSPGSACCAGSAGSATPCTSSTGR